MARVRMQESGLKNWNQVDETLKEIAENKRKITEIETKENKEIDEIKGKALEKAKPYQDKIKALEVLIKG